MSPKEESASKATPSSASAAVVKKSDETAKATKASPLHNFKQLFTFFRLLFATNPTWIDILLIISGTIFAAAAGVPFPLMGIIFGQLVDDMNGATCAAQQDDQGDPFRFEGSINDKVIKTAYIGAIALVLIYSYFVSWSVMSQRLAHRLRSQYVAALLRQSPAFFDVRSAAGEVSSRLHGDITAVQDGTSEKVGIFITTWSFFTTVFVIAFTKQPRLAGMLVSMLPAYLISVGVGSHYIKKFMAQASVAGDGSPIASEALSNIPVVRAFSAASRLEAKFADYVARGRTAGIKRGAIAATQAGMLYFVSYSGIALAFWQGSKMIAESAGESGGGATIGEIYAIVYLLIDSCVMLGNLAPILPIIGGASTAYLRLMEDIEAYSAVDGTSDEGHKLQPSLNKSIALRNVSFEYPSRAGQQVLRNVDVAFPAGSYTAIVGLSGSGKSTIAALIDRLYDPDEGIVEIDGVDLKTMNVRNLRSFISFVQQEPSLLDRSIFENIALGLLNSPKPAHEHLKPLILGNHLAECATKGKDTLSYTASKGAAYEELVALVTRAAEQADAINFVQGLQDGFGTMVGSKGALLSGGQRQRIALARALIRDPEILVLDEATSALDSASEKRIQRAVEQAATESRTVISIAHRLSTIRNADNIIVMEGGKVVEQGTYANLTANEQGAFARMVRLQSVGTTDDAGSLSGETTKGSVHTDDPVTAEKADANDQLKDTDKPVETQPVESPDDSNTAKADPPVTDPILSTTKPFGAAMKGAWWLVKPSRPFVILAIFAATLVGGTFSGSGLIFGYAVGGLNTCSNSAERILYLGRFFSGLMFMLAVVEFFANFFSWSSFGIISQRLLYSVKVLSFRSLLEQDVQWHQSGDRTASGLLEIITKDCAAVGGFSGSTLGTVFAVLVNVVVAVILSHIIGWKIALVCLASIPILLGAGFMQLRMLARYRERHTKAFSSATSVATEAVQSIRTVAALSLENQFMENYFNLLSKPRKELVVASASANIWLALNSTCSVFLNALAYWWGSQLMMKGEYTQTQFLIILIAMLTASKIWASMFTLAPEFGRAYSAFCHVLNVIELGSNHQLDQGGNSLRKLGGASPESKKDVEAVAEVKTPVGVSGREGLKITFTNVSFSYPNRPDAMVLDNVSFTVQPNQFCGLVGPSGAGKSTIMNLVQQLYSPTRGSILIDGEDILDVWPSIKDSVALVPQDPSLFAGSVRFNVGLGAPPDREATDAEIEEACKLANIHDFIVGLSDGYDSECGPSASHLSGGQRQRLAIARALVRRPRLLLLDESSSALDAASEAALQEGLEKVARSTTVLAITHRIHTVRRADTILVLEAGEIAERGRHTELMERSENYRINAMQQMLQ